MSEDQGAFQLHFIARTVLRTELSALVGKKTRTPFQEFLISQNKMSFFPQLWGQKED